MTKESPIIDRTDGPVDGIDTVAEEQLAELRARVTELEEQLRLTRLDLNTTRLDLEQARRYNHEFRMRRFGL